MDVFVGSYYLGGIATDLIRLMWTSSTSRMLSSLITEALLDVLSLVS